MLEMLELQNVQLVYGVKPHGLPGAFHWLNESQHALCLCWCV